MRPRRVHDVPMYRVLLSHAVEDAAFVGSLVTALEAENLAAFAAPRNVSPGTQWLVTLEHELRACQALLAVLTPAFRASEWCDQEVGYAFGLGHPVVPVRPTRTDPRPYGLLARFQPVEAHGRTPAVVAEDVFDALLTHEEQHGQLVDVVIDGLAGERDPYRLRRWVTRLQRLRACLADGRRERVAALAEGNAALYLDRWAHSTVTELLR